MSNPFERDDILHYALVNDEGQYSMWPATNDVPEGWTVVHGPADRGACHEIIESSWTDMRPMSLVRFMESASD
ncbi:MbtH family protein [Streptomyces sp. SBT349]|uniref:MbtH family protein n=1 Tax=Streptomyces sp. SBT349 TaxID=1580539 RepID=UPI00066D4091|nr:MbtH family NRPS accessory protein [Streptomyces sp. SBT349]